VHPAHHRQEVGLHSGSIDERRTDYDQSGSSPTQQLLQPKLRFELGNPVWIGRCGRVVSAIRLAERRAFTVDLDRANEHESPNAGSDGLACKAQGTVHVRSAKLGQRVIGCVMHDVHTSRGMDQHISLGDGFRPHGVRSELCDLDIADSWNRSQDRAAHSGAQFEP
jgi:hypothetical protein